MRPMPWPYKSGPQYDYDKSTGQLSAAVAAAAAPVTKFKNPASEGPPPLKLILVRRQVPPHLPCYKEICRKKESHGKLEVHRSGSKGHLESASAYINLHQPPSYSQPQHERES
ncbi:hypothetical protein ACE6H2_004349 [Prunus campanulata]